MTPEEQAVRQAVEKLRDALLTLHKALIDSERVSYEQTFGAIASPNAFLGLLINDPWFTWLRPLSGFITTLDEALDEDEPIKRKDAELLIEKARVLLTPSEEGEGFGRHYFIAMQRDPDVVLAHAIVAKLGK